MISLSSTVVSFPLRPIATLFDENEGYTKCHVH